MLQLCLSTAGAPEASALHINDVGPGLVPGGYVCPDVLVHVQAWRAPWVRCPQQEQEAGQSSV